MPVSGLLKAKDGQEDSVWKSFQGKLKKSYKRRKPE